jgi:hypothetical protein
MGTEGRGLLGRVRGAIRIDPARRRLYARLGIVALVLTVLVIVPGYLATRPTFLDRYSNYSSQVQTWEESVHAKVTCQACHVEPGVVSQTKYSARMLGEFYITPVLRSRKPALLSTPTNEACEACHIDLRTVSPSGDLNIPHRAHTDILELDCVACHDFLVHEVSPEGKHTPTMTGCLECHDGEQAKDACATCHTEKSTPENHQTPEWVVIHPDEQDETDCGECHAWVEDWCVECHDRRPRSHEGRWRSNHRYVVEERRNCEACHEAAFCIECHGEVPALNYDPALVLVE